MLRHIEEGWHESGASYFPDENFPLAPESIRDAYEQFWRETHCTTSEMCDKQRDLVLTNTLIADFCDEYVDTTVYSAAILGPILDALSDPASASAAELALRTYTSNSQNPKSAAYILGLLADRPVIDDFWKQNVAEQYVDQPELLQQLLATTPEEIPSELWQPDARLVSPDHMLVLVDTINLESLLIQSAETLVKLEDDKAANNNSTLQQVYKAESFLAPLCEIIGFDGLAMALRSRTNLLRATYTGKPELVERATHIIEEQGSVEQVDQNVQALFTAIFGESIHEQVVAHTAKHGIIIGEGTCTSKDLRVVWRQKTSGSLVEKLQRQNDPEFTPLDILGATIIAPGEHEVGERLGRIIERLHKDDCIKLVPAEGRTDAVHIKGTPDYIEVIREALGFDTVESMKRFVDVKEAEPGEYRVCKVTLVYSREDRPDLRAEIQITTESDRIEARIGSAAHLLYKMARSSRSSIDPTYLAAIRSRKINLSQKGNHLNPASAERALALYRWLTNT